MSFPTFHIKRQAHVYLLCSVLVLPFQTSTIGMVVILLRHLVIILSIFTLCCVKCLSKHKTYFYIRHREAQITSNCIIYYSDVLQIEFYTMFAWQH